MSYLPDLALALIVGATLVVTVTSRRSPTVDRTILALFLLVAVSIFYPNYVGEQSGLRSLIVRFHLREILFAGVLGLFAWDLLSRRRRLTLGSTLLLAGGFFTIATLSGLAGWIEGGIAIAHVLRDFHPLLFVFLAFLVPAIASSRESLTALIRLLATFSSIVLLLTPLQIVLAAEGAIFFPGFQPTRGLYFIGWSWAGISLANAFVFIALYHVISGSLILWKRLATAAAVLGGAGIVAVGFARMNWLALAITIPIVLLLLPFRLKLRFTVALIGVTAGLILLYGAATALTPNAAARSLARVEFLFSTMLDSTQYKNSAETGERTSFGRRLMENQIAWDVFTSNPILGAGLGYKYWENVALFTPSGDQVSLRNIYIRGGTYIHNSWFWLLSKVGLLGTVTFGLFITVPFVKAFLGLNRLHDPLDRAVAFGFGFRGFALLIEAVAHPHFFTVATATGLGLMAGTISAAFNVSRGDSTDDTSHDHCPLFQRRAWRSLPLGTA